MTVAWPWHRFCDVVATHGATVACTYGEQSLRFDQLLEMAGRQAASLTRLRPGDRVGIVSDNDLHFPVAVAAVWGRGGIPVLVHSNAPESQIAHAFRSTEPKYVCAPYKHQFHNWPKPSSVNIASCPELSAESTASIVFTSGSTGLPKGVMQSAENLTIGARTISNVMRYTPDDRILCPVPFAFDYGWGQLLSMLLEGIPLVLPNPANGFGLCAALDQYSPTVFAAVPAVLADLMSGLAPITTSNRDTVRLITSTGSKMPLGVLERTKAIFPKANVCLNYGLTETYRSTSLDPHYLCKHPASAGKALPGTDLRILRCNGELASIGEVGEIVHFGNGSFQGYWREPERTNETKRYVAALGKIGVFTGDLGHSDEDGFLFVKGRKDRLIKSMGVRVSPDEVETLLSSFESVAEVAVVSKPHEVLGDMIVAFVVPSEASTGTRSLQKELKKYARGCMSSFMQPRAYHIIETLPRNPSNKVDYVRLQTILEEIADG